MSAAPLTPEPDRIHLRDHLVEAEIGAFAGERDRRQRLRFTVEAALTGSTQAAGDDVDRVLSYDVLVAAVADALADRRFDLVEALAEDIAARVLGHPQAGAVRVTVEKLDRVPGALGVTILRQRGEARAADRPMPQVPVLRQDAAPQDTPPQGAAILVPDAPGLPLPATGDPVQLALLALDQGAWALAGRLGLEVAATRTEMEAAAEAGRAVVWAPARMVREASDLAGADRAQPEVLARWLAARLQR